MRICFIAFITDWIEGLQDWVCLSTYFKGSVVNYVVFQVGRILQRDKDQSRAMVQLDRYEEKVFTLDYDSICHYVGGGDH